MATISTFNKNNLQDLRTKLNDAVSSVSEEFGIVIDLGRISYSPEEAAVRLTMTAVSNNQRHGESPEDVKLRMEFEKYAHSFGLNPADFGRQVKVGDDEFKIVGIKPRRSRFPIVGMCLNTGKVFKLTLGSVKSQLTE
ncbi:hypothetical protein [Alteromonas sp. BZK5]|uniref:hypothetical protein n=1 Tax=Alteromonas sp. BZK5 TaxID=1904459 RepID=UPI001653519F|nr:hypothetical protein [Alteromonas sp. BZK5]MBC6987924.1 hypothetical protein [Alteromonas sp. BZK5]